MIKITKIELSKDTVKKGEQFKVMVTIEEKLSEPTSYRLPFVLNSPKGGIR